METLVIFDFDWSLIDCNSDTWVVEKLGAMERMKSFRDTLPWTQLMVNNVISLSSPFLLHTLKAYGRILSFVHM